MRYSSLKCVIIFVVRKQVLCHYFNELYFFRVQRNSLKKWTSQHRAEIRQKILQHTEVNQLNAAKGIELLAAQRWLDRLVAHTYRFSNVLYESILKNEERKFKNGC
jgi:phosphate:Na+ symporter